MAPPVSCQDGSCTLPIGARAVAWIDKYLRQARPELVVEPDQGTIFLTTDGEAFSGNALTALVRGYVDAAEIGKRGSCHLHPRSVRTVVGGTMWQQSPSEKG